MGAMTDYLETNLLDHADGKTAYSKPTAVYAALCTASPTDTGSQASEVSASGYARQPITSSMGAASSPTGTALNTGVVTHGPAGASWGTITDAAFADALTTGNYLLDGGLSSSRTIALGDSFQWAASQISLAFD